MSCGFLELLSRLHRPPSESIAVLSVPERSSFYAGRDHIGAALLLVKLQGAGSRLPLRLAGLSVEFEVQCQIVEPGAGERVETLTLVRCLSTDRAIETYFASAVEILIGVIGTRPSAAEFSAALENLIALFQKLRQPARKSVVGLVGELMVIYRAAATADAVSAWRSDPDERYDFCADELRVEAKATATRRRVHSVSFEQADPPQSSIGLLASVFVEHASGGVSLGALIEAIERRLPSEDKWRIRLAVADTLGQEFAGALSWCFDLALAEGSLAFFDLRAVPAIRGALPIGVSQVRFVTDLSSCHSISSLPHSQLSARARGVLPVGLAARN